MKIQCLSVILSLVCLAPCAASTVQVRRFMQHKAPKALASMPHGQVLSDLSEEPKDKVKKPEHKSQSNSNTLWSGTSNINLEVTLIIASVWVIVLGSAPILIYKLGNKQVTNSAIVLSCLMWLALFGGLYLFTQIILFNSPHFDRVRSLTIIECTYFMTQVITTVGYGDITPAMPRGQVFVGLYVTLSFFVIALLMSEMQRVVMDKVNRYKEQLQEKVQERARERGYSVASLHPSHSDCNVTSGMSFKPSKPSVDGLVSSVSIFAGVAFVWVLFFHYYPGEEKTWLQAIYMSLITLSTVGFGAITPVTEGGMLFGAFFMFIGTSALVNVVQNFSTYILEMDQYESWCPKEFESGLKKFREKYAAESGQSISEEKFLILTLLQKKLVTENQIDQIKESFKLMSGNKGKLNLRGIASNVSSEIDRADLGDSDTEAGSLQPSVRSS